MPLSDQLDPEHERTWVEEAMRNPHAFEHLYNHYFPRVYAYICYRVARQQDGEDLVADTFLKAVEAMGQGRFQWRHAGSFAAWLFRIAHNSVSDFQERGRKWGDMMPLADAPELRAGEPMPEEWALQREQFAHLRTLLDTLSPRRKEIIMLKFYGGLRNSEIAEVLALNEHTVASHLCRGLEDLHRKYLEEPAQTMENSR
jgi:RNA polymerase sigma-70 factor (ECF subfamily)